MQSLTGIRSSIPQMNRYPEGPGIKALFHSVRDIALIIDKTVRGGFGYLKAGTVMSVLTGTGELVPFVPLYSGMVFGGVYSLGVAPLVQNAASAHVYVSIADSYKFAVGDDIYLDRVGGGTPVLAETITEIDRTTSTLYADITTTAFSASNLTVANGAYAYVPSYASTPFSAAAYILDKDIDTGVGDTALGALTSVVVSNCVLYKNSLYNLTAAAITSLGGVVDGRFFIMK
jgi:hypothetical protein